MLSSLKLLASWGEIYKRKFSNKIFGVITLKPSKKNKENVLLSYDPRAFLRHPGRRLDPFHANQLMCTEIAKFFLELGYCVDIIAWDRTKFIPKKNYAFFIDIHQNLERLYPFINRDCIKIMFAIGAHWLFQNNAEYSRLSNLKKRRGVVLTPRRIMPPTNNIDYANHVIALGNKFTHDTYGYAKKTIHSLSVFSTVTFDFPNHKNFLKYRKNFVWIGGGGMVHKGLDLVLECFKDMPDYQLTVCGPVSSETNFEKFYYRELYETENIKTVGMINISGKQFLDIIHTSIALIYPSCSEGQAGSVITAMHAGLIPVISYESGVDVHDFGKILKENTIKEIKESVQEISELSESELGLRAKKAWEYARVNHTKGRFIKQFGKSINNILATHKK